MNDVRKRQLKIAIPFAVGGYSIYAIGKLTDKIPNERLYVSTALILGLGTTYAFAMGGSNKANAVGAFSGGTLGYALARGIFKQSPKVSLIAGALFAAGTYYYMQNPDILRKQTTQQPAKV
jgi:hypothetical protein